MATTNNNTTKESKGLFASAVAYGESNRFGIIVMLLLLTGCLGGVTVGVGGIGNDLALIPVIATTMLSLSMILAVAPMKYIISTSVVAVIVDIIVLIGLFLG